MQIPTDCKQCVPRCSGQGINRLAIQLLCISLGEMCFVLLAFSLLFVTRHLVFFPLLCQHFSLSTPLCLKNKGKKKPSRSEARFFMRHHETLPKQPFFLSDLVMALLSANTIVCQSGCSQWLYPLVSLVSLRFLNSFFYKKTKDQLLFKCRS